MVQWDTEDDKGDVYFVKIDYLSWENGGCRYDSYRICGDRHDSDRISREDLMTRKGQ